MKSLEQFKAEQAARLEKEIEEHAELIKRAECFERHGLPVPDRIAAGNLYGAITCHYPNKATAGIREPADPRSMAQAVELFRQFADAGRVVSFHVLRSSCVVMHPEQHMPERLKREGYKRDAYKSAAYAVKLSVTHAVDRNHTSAELEFFASLGGKLFRVSIPFGLGYIGQCPKLAPRVVTERDPHTEVIIARKIEPNADAYGTADSCLSFSYGGDIGAKKTGADHRFLFVADHDADDVPADCSHALGQLENLAAIVDGTNKAGV